MMVAALASSASAQPWGGPMAATGLDGLARCGSLYALLAANDVRPDARALYEGEMMAHLTALDAGDRLQRGEPVLADPQLSKAWIAVVSGGIQRYRDTIAERMARVGEEATRGFLADESARCEALRASAVSLAKPKP